MSLHLRSNTKMTWGAGGAPLLKGLDDQGKEFTHNNFRSAGYKVWDKDNATFTTPEEGLYIFRSRAVFVKQNKEKWRYIIFQINGKDLKRCSREYNEQKEAELECADQFYLIPGDKITFKVGGHAPGGATFLVNSSSVSVALIH